MKRTIIAALVIFTVLALAITAAYAYHTYYAVEIVVDEQVIGKVRDSSEADSAIAFILLEMQGIYDADMSVTNEISYKPIWAGSDDLTTQEDMLLVLKQNLEILAFATAIKIEGEPVLFVRSPQEADHVLRASIERLTPLAEDAQHLTQKVQESYEFEKTEITPEQLTSVETAIDILVNGTGPIQVSYASEQETHSLLTVETSFEKQEVEPIPFSTKRIASKDLYVGQTNVKSEGKAGSKELRVLYRYVNGRETAREILEERVVSKPVQKVVYYGIKNNYRVTDGTITSRFGMRSGRMHNGIDIAAKTGTPIRAYRTGVVSYAGSASGYGLVVYIDHPNGMQTRYAHCSKLGVTAGQEVKQGQIIAYVGSTGRSTGPHLHFEIRVNGEAKDPLSYLR